jgi:4-aminobutyrate aminotransferase
MSLQESSTAQSLIERRARVVSRAVPSPRLVVSRAEGATITDVDGRAFLDFVGGIGCQNLGHGLDAVVEAIHAQADRYLHQMAAVGSYEPYVEVCEKLAELSPCPGPQKSVLVNSGAEAVENAVKVARAYTGRPAVLVFDYAFHGRTLLCMTMTSKLIYKKGFGPFAPEVYRTPAPYPYRGVSTDDALGALQRLFRSDLDPATVACAVLEPVQGEGGFIPMTEEFPARLAELLDRHGILFVDDEVQAGCGRTGRMWAIEHYGVEPDLVVSGKSLGGGLPLAAVTGRAEIMDAPEVGGLGGTFGGNPVSCAAAAVVLDQLSRPHVLARAEVLGERLRTELEALQERIEEIGEVRGIGPMLAIELVTDRESKAPAGELVARTVAEAYDRGLLLLAAGLDGNVIRLLPPLNLPDEDVERGLALLEEALVAAGATVRS